VCAMNVVVYNSYFDSVSSASWVTFNDFIFT